MEVYFKMFNDNNKHHDIDINIKIYVGCLIERIIFELDPKFDERKNFDELFEKLQKLEYEIVPHIEEILDLFEINSWSEACKRCFKTQYFINYVQRVLDAMDIDKTIDYFTIKKFRENYRH